MTRDPWSVLSTHQQTIAKAWLEDRKAERKHLVIYLSGAHAYGFPSPDSDLDLKSIHIAPTRKIVGLTPGDDGREKTEIVEGVELDYSSNELALALRGMLKGNGNFLERVLGDLALDGDFALLAELRPLVQAALSRQVSRHYRGFAMSQLKAFDEKPTAKRALYVIRTAATGRCLLVRGVLETDVTRLEDFVPAGMNELMAIKRTGEREPLSPDVATAWRARLVETMDAVDAAYPASVLPVEPPAEAQAAIDDWLQRVRRDHWE